MNLLTPNALEVAAKDIYNLRRLRQTVEDLPWSLISHQEKQPYLSEAEAAFNTAIAKLIEEGQAKKGKFLNDAHEPTIWSDGIFIKGEP